MLQDRTPRPALIAGLYDAAANPTLWQVALDAVRSDFAAEAGIVWRHAKSSKGPTVVATSNWTSQAARLLQGHQTPVHHLSPGHDHLAVSAVRIDETEHATFGLHRLHTGAAFNTADREALSEIAHHTAAALRLQKMLDAERMASAARGAALDQCSHGAVITTDDGVILFANRAAVRLQTEGFLSLGAAGLRCADPRLAAIIRSATRGRAEFTLRIGRMTGPPAGASLAVTVAPLPLEALGDLSPRRGTAPQLALVTLRQVGATSDTGQAPLMELFGLTGAEAALVPQLVTGESMALIAQSRGVSAATVRAQAGRVLEKTGATNLRALATLIAGLGCG